MTSLMAEDSDATAILAALAGPGRPTADEKREKSVQERFRVPASWSSYIEHAAIRDGFNNKSKYLKASSSRMLARITKSTACRPRNTEGERFVTIPSRGPFPFFHSPSFIPRIGKRTRPACRRIHRFRQSETRPV